MRLLVHAYLKKTTAYFICSGLFPLLLWYPSMIFMDLAGMGGYDGFASVSFMEKYGVWSSQDSHAVVYYFFNAIFIFWAASLINIPVALILLLKEFWVKLHH
ncbi:hypothetical protein U14_03643 [Candidatus Moduliflexus flocculans]|uniref:Uncharacterized protein n=1 Tax=Candidatus Moduliflexus flocculans TaxID=1499966 RepID=A0A081BPS6_9BACT|nr:hypothetical protein U14_03643 [Candidatus Moduliflexus flocculans]